jgi:hypothetical protein
MMADQSVSFGPILLLVDVIVVGSVLLLAGSIGGRYQLLVVRCCKSMSLLAYHLLVERYC